jgi:hypothetical protein
MTALPGFRGAIARHHATPVVARETLRARVPPTAPIEPNLRACAPPLLVVTYAHPLGGYDEDVRVATPTLPSARRALDLVRTNEGPRAARADAERRRGDIPRTTPAG